jgi:hypothetical protein
MCKSLRRKSSQISSQVALESALYSASEELLDMVACFLAFHDMSEVPRKKQNPDVDLLVSMHPAQSASEKPSNCISLLLGSSNPLPGLVFKYLITLQAA